MTHSAARATVSAVPPTGSASLLTPDEQLDARALLAWMDALGVSTDGGHPLRVMQLTLALADVLQLAPTPAARRTALRAGLLHDVGKLLVPATVLDKPGALSALERTAIERHAASGAWLAARYPGIESEVVRAVRHHHERYAGGGYPAGQIGAEIPLLARVLSVADVYDALTSVRPYRAAWTPVEARTYLHANAGTHFDPQVVRALGAVLDWQDTLAGPAV